MPKIPTREILWEAAEIIESIKEPADQDLAMMIRDAKFFEKYLGLCVHNAPFANAILGAMMLGWQLRDKTVELECSKIITDLHSNKKKVHLA